MPWDHGFERPEEIEKPIANNWICLVRQILNGQYLVLNEAEVTTDVEDDEDAEDAMNELKIQLSKDRQNL